MSLNKFFFGFIWNFLVPLSLITTNALLFQILVLLQQKFIVETRSEFWSDIQPTSVKEEVADIKRKSTGIPETLGSQIKKS